MTRKPARVVAAMMLSAAAVAVPASPSSAAPARPDNVHVVLSADCTGYDHMFTGTLAEGGSDTKPDNRVAGFYEAGAGTHEVCLDGPSGAEFWLNLKRVGRGYCCYEILVEESGPGDDKSITYTTDADFYAVDVFARSGSGSFTVGLSYPDPS